jgi:hypothetical protein
MPNRVITVRLIRAKAEPNTGFLGQVFAKLAKLKEYAPVITGFSTLVLSIASYVYVRGINTEKEERAATQARQEALDVLKETNLVIAEVAPKTTNEASPSKTEAKTKTEGANTARTEVPVRTKEKDPAKMEVAAITLAAYGETALPTIHILLAGSNAIPNMQAFGMLVVHRWMDAGDSDSRQRMLKELSNYAKSDSKASRVGAYKALIEISDQLGPQEDRIVLSLLVDRFGSETGMAETDSAVARIACPLLNNSRYDYSEVRLALQNMANSDAAAHALQSYRTVLKHNLSASSCQTLVRDLEGIKLKDSLASSTLPQELEALKAVASQGCKP